MEIGEDKIVVPYKNLADPPVFQKVLDASKAMGIEEVVITAGDYFDYHGGSDKIRMHFVLSGPTSEFWRSHPHPYFGPIFSKAMKRAKANKETLEKALELTQELIQKGINATIEESSVEEVKVYIDIYQEIIEEGEEKWGPFPW